MQAFLTFEKYETTNYEVGGTRRYCQNILQWNKNNMNSMKWPTEATECFLSVVLEKALNVVYSDQKMPALQTTHWLKSTFWT